jgi:hypothetical protein
MTPLSRVKTRQILVLLHKPVCISKLALFTTMFETRSQVKQYKHQKMQKTPITGVRNVRITQLGLLKNATN